jgi:hypothetical protein
MNPPVIQFKTTLLSLFSVLALGCLLFAPTAQAQLPPPAPDGGYPGFNTAEGSNALFNLTNGQGNTAVGNTALFNNTTGFLNTATGVLALQHNTNGFLNTAYGAIALQSNVGGIRHTAVGHGALFTCTAAPAFAGNTAVGTEALFKDTTGNFNTAVGDAAMKLNTIGTDNVAIGLDALVFNSEGNVNVAVGANALFNNTLGVDNTATGGFALFTNAMGSSNTAVGMNALVQSTGDSNTAVGLQALQANTSGGSNTALGINAGSSVTTASNVICIGSGVFGANVSNTCFIGNIRGVTTGNMNAVNVVIDSAGQLGTVSSSARFKKDIQPMDKASEAVLALKPVTFHYQSDKTNTPQFGLVAEDVAKVNPDLIVHDEDGQIYTVRYDAVNAMLLNEFLKEHRKVEKLEATVAQQHKDFEAAVAALKGQIQKVSAQFDVSRPAPQTVAENP